MTGAVSLNGGTRSLTAAPAPGSDPARRGEMVGVGDRDRQRQMLSAARSADFGGDELFGGQGEETFREMRDARFAEVAASTGAIGLASSIEAQLARFLGPEG